ncbi:hypothetical protein IF129_14690 [Streptomyces chumphonensis]|uniref:Uncharacterized protein n=1 Tax=Streptomyces chumphonensis TaxID=1214925 RepID=A0A927F1U0_9ACTN|nr:hypothetical protein [Streptomyces chumphonensis]MBD3932797.1 hypothetical protein [Streptomyces chumphonensis]
MTTGGTAYYYLTDALGSVIALTDEHGNKKNIYAYTPTSTLRASRTDEEVPQSYRFAAGYQDATGLFSFADAVRVVVGTATGALGVSAVGALCGNVRDRCVGAAVVTGTLWGAAGGGLGATLAGRSR